MDHDQAEAAINEILAQDWITSDEFVQAVGGSELNEGNAIAFVIWRERGPKRFRLVDCPDCQESGFARWRFLGQLAHPGCGARWVVPPWTWVAQRARCSEAPGSAKGVGEAVFSFWLFLVLWATSVVLCLPFQLAVFALRERSRRPAAAAFSAATLLGLVVGGCVLALR